ncbi:hypothetical protein [Methylobacter psychrophilus]|uniref:hypothetical protein n=1 Tax=Methylobacter psychrophilus TaxID=96941 RepID=UPI0021D4A0CD|nr:hypothetical protein [Methylobacter psychrophilus]
MIGKANRPLGDCLTVACEYSLTEIPVNTAVNIMQIALSRCYSVNNAQRPPTENFSRSFQLNLFRDTNMTQKKATASMESKAVTETLPVNPETKTDVVTQPQQAEQPQQTEQVTKSSKTGRGAATGDLSSELIELVTELRETVRRIDPRKHTEKTLRRVLFNISDILKDIETLYTKS